MTSDLGSAQHSRACWCYLRVELRTLKAVTVRGFANGGHEQVPPVGRAGGVAPRPLDRMAERPTLGSLGETWRERLPFVNAALRKARIEPPEEWEPSGD